MQLIDPTLNFIQAVKKDAYAHGREAANKLFEGDMAEVMGEVFGDILVESTLCSIGNSLWDVPMQKGES